MPNGLSCSASRVAGENGPAVRRACGHAALPRCRLMGPGLPVSRARRVSATPAVFALVCFAMQNDPAAAPACVSGPTACLLASGKPGVKTHTHEYGIISSGWPPNQPTSRIAKLFGEGHAGCEVYRAREVALVVSSGAWKTFAPSKLAATPSLTRTDSVNQKSAMPPHACGGHQTQTLEMNTWPTIKRQHTRQSNSSA